MLGAMTSYEIFMVLCTCDSSVTIKISWSFLMFSYRFHLDLVLCYEYIDLIFPTCSTMIQELQLLQCFIKILRYFISVEPTQVIYAISKCAKSRKIFSAQIKI